MKVLLVEDEEFIRDLFKRQLDLSGFTTDAFGTGNDGLAALGKNAYDLVLLDIMLPDINGLQILQNIRQNPANKAIAVVLLTNLGQDAVIKQGFELGADGYLVKAAYTPDQIVQEVKNIMQKKQSAQPVAVPGAGVPAVAAVPVIPAPAMSASPPAAPATPTPPPPVNLEPHGGSIMNPTIATGAMPPVPSAPIPFAPVGPTSSEVVSQAASFSNMEMPPTVATSESTDKAS